MLEIVAVIALMSLLASLGVVGFSRVNAESGLRLAQGDIASVRTAQVRHATAHGRFTPDPAFLRLPAGVSATAGPSLDPGEVSVAVGEDGSLALAAKGTADTCATTHLTVWSGPRVETTGSLPPHNVCDARSVLEEGVVPLQP